MFAYELVVVKSFFEKREDHLMSFESSTTKAQIYYFLIRADNRRLYKDCLVIPSEYLGTPIIDDRCGNQLKVE